jgi:hypothetical protein
MVMIKSADVVAAVSPAVADAAIKQTVPQPIRRAMLLVLVCCSCSRPGRSESEAAGTGAAAADAASALAPLDLVVRRGHQDLARTGLYGARFRRTR